jgi:hypothetical protein
MPQAQLREAKHYDGAFRDCRIAGETLAAVQIAMIAGLPYTALRYAVLTHPTLVEGLISLFSSAASAHNVVEGPLA